MNKKYPQRQLVARDISDGFGKLPPQALDMEEAVLGAAMLEKGALMAVIDSLKPEDFYSDTNSIIWEEICNLFNSNEPVDMRSVVASLRKSGRLEIIDGQFRIAELTSKVSSGANIEHHAKVIQEMSIKRKLIFTASRIHHRAYEETTDVFEVLDEVQSEFDKISNSYFKKGAVDAATIYKATIQKLVDNRKNSGVTGIPTGYTELDKITGGWQSPNLIVIAARPGFGKTVVGVCCAVNAALEFNKPIAIFSLEMSSTELMNRMIASESEVDLEKIIHGKTNDIELDIIGKKSAKLIKAPMFIDDTPSLSILELRAKARRLKHEHKIQMIIVDYLQLMRGEKGGNREQEIASISRGLKGIAKELEIPVIALAQLSRAMETRGGDKRPIMSDLRESGQIEADSDVIIFLYRPEMYKITVDENGNSTHGLLEAIVAKNRNGKTGSVNLRFIGKYVKITNLPEFEPPEGFTRLPAPKRIEDPRIVVVRDPTESGQNDHPDDLPF